MEKLLLLDGHSILARAFFGIPDLSTHEGIHTNAVYGFLNILFKYLDDEKPQYIVSAFDLDRTKLLRTKEYPDYKGNRKPMPKELHEQIPLIQEILKAMDIPVLTLIGYEADDILGTISKKAQEKGYEVTIVSGDRDLLQLSDEHICVSITKTSKGRTLVFNYHPEDVLKEYGVTPTGFIELKGLMGDSSDNIPGLPGVGPKTATDIVIRFKTIENAYANLEEIKPPRARKALMEHVDLALLSRKLATIDVNSPIDYDFKEGDANKIYTGEALELMRKLELKSISARFAKYKVNDDVGNHFKKNDIRDLSKLKIVDDEYMASVIFKDMETEKMIGIWTYLDTKDDETHSLAISLTLNKDRVYLIKSGENYDASKIKADLLKALQIRIEKKLVTSTLSLKEQLKIINLERNEYIKDVSLAFYLLHPNQSSHDYDDISSDILDITLEDEKELLGKKDLINALYEDDENALRLLVYKSEVAFFSLEKLMEKLNALGMSQLFNEIEMPLVYSLSHMEKAGIAVDKDSLKNYADFLKNEIDKLTNEIYEFAGEIFNINSPLQLGIILFEKLGIRGAKKTKTGYSTAADVLEKLAGEHPIVPKVLRYRAVTKLYSTYAYGLNEYIGEDGRIHSTFNQMITATGRISSTDPNLQNIPVRTNEGKEIRKVFVPQAGYVFVDADYSQVELRILAALSGDEALIKAYKDAVDIHALTASRVFHVPVNKVTEEMRRNAKAVNFGIVYGISAFGLGEGLSISRKEASEYIKQYFESYPKVKEYLDKSVESARENGFVTTAFGRIRPIPEIKNSNYAIRNFGERIAMNSPIQGTAADIMKIAMNDVDRKLAKMKSRIVLQVHDELLIETKKSEVQTVKKLVKDSMERAASLSVPLIVDVREGNSWYECH